MLLNQTILAISHVLHGYLRVQDQAQILKNIYYLP